MALHDATWRGIFCAECWHQTPSCRIPARAAVDRMVRFGRRMPRPGLPSPTRAGLPSRRSRLAGPGTFAIDAELETDPVRDAAGLNGILGARSGVRVRDWVRVEAALKADGRGLRVDPGSSRHRTSGRPRLAGGRAGWTRDRGMGRRRPTGPRRQCRVQRGIGGSSGRSSHAVSSSSMSAPASRTTRARKSAVVTELPAPARAHSRRRPAKALSPMRLSQGIERQRTTLVDAIVEHAAPGPGSASTRS